MSYLAHCKRMNKAWMRKTTKKQLNYHSKAKTSQKIIKVPIQTRSMVALMVLDIDMVVTGIEKDMKDTTTIMVGEETNKIIMTNQILIINRIWISKVQTMVIVKEGIINLMLNAITIINIAIMWMSSELKTMTRVLIPHKKLKIMETMHFYWLLYHVNHQCTKYRR